MNEVLFLEAAGQEYLPYDGDTEYDLKCRRQESNAFSISIIIITTCKICCATSRWDVITRKLLHYN